MNTVQYVSVLVIRPAGDGHEILLGLRARGRYMGGTWQLITGGIEPGETAWQAAVREVREEAGLIVEELYRLSQITQFYRPDIDAICTAPMFCALVDAHVTFAMNHEHTQLNWTPIELATARLMWPGDHAAVNEASVQILAGGPAKMHQRIALDSFK